MTGLSAIAGLFRPRAAPVRAVPGGSLLYEVGDHADAVFLVTAGALAVFRTVEGRRSLLGVVRPGEIVGESAVLAGTARSATVVALRDSAVRALPAPAFFKAARRNAAAMTEIAQLLIERGRSANAARRYEPPRIVAVASLSPAIAAGPLARRLAAAIEREGRTVAVLDREAATQDPDWWFAVEQAHDMLLCAVEQGDEAWAGICRRQADRTLVVGRGVDPPPAECRVCADQPLAASALVDLVLVHDGERVLVDGGALLNLPTGLLRADHDGTVVAVDVSRSRGLTPAEVERPRPLARWLWSGAWRRGPPLMSILMRSATIAAEPELRAAKEAADLYVMPEVADIEIRNWRAFDRAVQAGDDAVTRALDTLDGPVRELRRRREQAAAMPM